jgi:hypothetical protein
MGLLLDGMLNKCEPDCTEFGERIRFVPSSRGRFISPDKGRENCVPLIVTSVCLIDGGNGMADIVEVLDAAGFRPTVTPLTVKVVVAVAAVPYKGIVCPPTTTLDGSTIIVAPPSCVTVVVSEPGVIVVVPRTIAGGKVGACRDVVVSVLKSDAGLVGLSPGDIGAPADMPELDGEGLSTLEVVLRNVGLGFEVCGTWVLVVVPFSFLGGIS